ncbi:pyridoxal-phosphate dependent enzyme [Halorubellus sp. JP-L1]|uniref:pyridoxal-phosphate dependent enzyme n=1 Tax=Halorubellus sp. JP-L1 TaxID=2715753 RepID=UPI00140E5E4C|nr:pyridoxal-phosphate dependent enzyme [Halorubellus sp. JP-L1]NHN41918.1 pyridoxal-phosphate dependent enzyme [Halorubellus sp. JP-L1]
MVRDLTCPNCDATYAASADEPWRCTCGHALNFVDQPVPGGDPLPVSQLDTRRGLWTFHEFLPVERRVSFDEGFTPLVDADDWGASFKLEYLFPSGSFKDRGATTTLSRAVDLGVEKVVEDSSGNAGAAIATYAARAGIEADIYVPADVKQSKLMAIQRAGARPVRVEGSREDVTAAAIDAVEDGDGWYASHAWNPAFYAGTMTFALELVAQRDWTAPDAVVLPCGHGTLLLGAYRGFDVLERAGIIDEIPPLFAAQAAGYAPVVEARHGAVGTTAIHDEDEPEAPNEIADGIQIREPARLDEIQHAIEASGGDAIALGENIVENTLDDLHRDGFYVEPTCAIAPAALRKLQDAGVLSPDHDVVVPLTGSGLKTM